MTSVNSKIAEYRQLLEDDVISREEFLDLLKETAHSQPTSGEGNFEAFIRAQRQAKDPYYDNLVSIFERNERFKEKYNPQSPGYEKEKRALQEQFRGRLNQGDPFELISTFEVVMLTYLLFGDEADKLSLAWELLNVTNPEDAIISYNLRCSGLEVEQLREHVESFKALMVPLLPVAVEGFAPINGRIIERYAREVAGGGEEINPFALRKKKIKGGAYPIPVQATEQGAQYVDIDPAVQEILNLKNELSKANGKIRAQQASITRLRNETQAAPQPYIPPPQNYLPQPRSQQPYGYGRPQGTYYRQGVRRQVYRGGEGDDAPKEVEHKEKEQTSNDNKNFH